MPHAMCPRDRSQASKDPRQIRRRSRAERMLPCPKAMSGILRRAAGFLTSTRSRTTLKIAQTFRADHDASCTVAGGCGKILREEYHRETGQERTMHFVISGTWGPTDPTRAMLPFIFAASAVQDGDTVTLMLFHDAVLMAVDGAGAKLQPVGPPNRYEEVASHPHVILWACPLASMLAALPLLHSIIGSSSAG